MFSQIHYMSDVNMQVSNNVDMAGNKNGNVFSHPCFRTGGIVEGRIVLVNKLITNW